ncbi:PPOX class probable F420-dependent enzyme [Nocardioides albertanoniae]|uniref:PPOX class probable F420-dependent enzyme n=1 Tax=Nocardioides albertanoniae TaxID=1175486 RepID=A0A543A761_9ACTN|nr:TIGR03618 family F420-dependent PPOX class oxidoreductase [Nocardioides albertanoniae]TQL68445.1 PPOX class probable F420-dependent enzyme [Nocardioides albertanoniae]
MAGSRQSVQLTDAEIEEFLGSQLKVQVATVGSDGAPHLTTLFYVLDEGKIAFWTYASSQKVRNLRRDPRVTCLVEDGVDYFELRGVSITGTARLVEDYDEIKAIGTQVMNRMAGGADLGEAGDDLVSKQAHKRVGIVIEPDKVASWDHRKLGALPGQGSGQ